MLDHGNRDFRDFFNITKKDVKGNRDFRDFFNDNENSKK